MGMATILTFLLSGLPRKADSVRVINPNLGKYPRDLHTRHVLYPEVLLTAERYGVDAVEPGFK